MRTPELSDEELDALFRQGAEDYPEELNLGAWARMEQQLDEARVQQLVNRKVARWFAAEIGMVAVLLLLWAGYRSFVGATEPALAPQPTLARAAAGPAAVTSGALVAQAPQAEPGQKPDVPASPLPPGPMVAAAPAADPGSRAAAPALASRPEPAAGPTGVAGNGPARRHRVRSGRAALGLNLPAATDDTQPTARDRNGAAATRRPDALRRRPGGKALLFLAAAGRRGARPGSGWSGAETPGPAAVRPTTLRGAKAARAAAAARAAEARAAGAAGPTEAASARAGLPAPSGSPAALLPSEQQNAELPGSPAAEAPGAATAAVGTTEGAGTEDPLEPVQPQLLPAAVPALPAQLAADSLVRRPVRPVLPSRLFITALHAPEWSTVRGAGLDRVGRSTGLQLEYLLARRLRLSVGLLTTLKYYQARGSDYRWTRPPQYPVERISATCRITDIPVDLRYDALQGVRYRLFVRAGLSSLLMRDETYQYNYRYYGTSYSRSWQIQNGANHPFSVVNLAAGLERQLTARWALQAEPYLKLPLGGVGQGQVRLSSGGVFFGLKYGL